VPWNPWARPPSPGETCRNHAKSDLVPGPAPHPPPQFAPSQAKPCQAPETPAEHQQHQQHLFLNQPIWCCGSNSKWKTSKQQIEQQIKHAKHYYTQPVYTRGLHPKPEVLLDFDDQVQCTVSRFGATCKGLANSKT
jgi:hypothetical protein